MTLQKIQILEWKLNYHHVEVSYKVEHKAEKSENRQKLNIERTAIGNQLDENQNMEILTEQTWLPASERNLKQKSF